MDTLEKLKSFAYFILDFLVEWFWNALPKQQSHSCVLMYHDLTYEIVNPVQSCLHNVNDFLRALIYFEEEGYEFVSIDKAIELPPYGHKYVSITFDDVYSSVFSIAYPILREKKIPFTLFVSPGLLGSKSCYLTESQLEQLSTDTLCTIGAHTMTHPMLRKIANSYDEMLQSKIWLENKIGKTVNYFAYPYGKYCSVSVRVMKQAQNIGYKCAFGTVDAPINKFTKYFMFYLPRMVVHK